MNDTRSYRIQLEGHISEETINAGSPFEIVVTQTDTSTLCTVSTDQSGLIGLLRHLHARGLILLSITSHLERSGE